MPESPPRVCFLFGAGASADFECPTMDGFFASAAALVGTDCAMVTKMAAVDKWRAGVAARGALVQRNAAGPGAEGLPKADNLEDVFCVAETEASFRDTATKEVVHFLQDVIAYVYTLAPMNRVMSALERRFWRPGDQPELGYDRLVHELRNFADGILWKDRCTFLTANYDVALDSVVATTPAHRHKGFYGQPGWEAGDTEQELIAATLRHPLYWLGRFSDEAASGIMPRLLKLHGSVNWGECSDPGCDAPVRQFSPFLHFHSPIPARVDQVLATERCQYHPGPDSARPPHRPYVLPPSLKALRGRSSLQRIWSQAGQDLADASCVIIVGHSLPPTDVHLRHFLAVALTDGRPKDVMLVNTNECHLRIYASFVEGLTGKPCCRRHGKFAASVPHIMQFIEQHYQTE